MIRLSLMFLVCGCSTTSRIAAHEAVIAALSTIADRAASAQRAHADPAANVGQWPDPPLPAKPDEVVHDIGCARNRSYIQARPYSSRSPWSCYFENSEGRRYPCNEDGTAPPDLVEWCNH